MKALGKFHAFISILQKIAKNHLMNTSMKENLNSVRKRQNHYRRYKHRYPYLPSLFLVIFFPHNIIKFSLI